MSGAAEPRTKETNGTKSNQLTSTDFDRRAVEYDRALPRVQPMTDALLGRLPKIDDGGLVLDIGCGTGEPGLTLARRDPGVQVLGIDSSPGMIAVARHKAAAEPVPNARFEVMAAEHLDLPTDSAAAVISRQGLLIFTEPVASAAEMARILVPGGWFSLAVWDRTSLHTSLDLALWALGDVLPSHEIPNFGWMDDLAVAGKRENVLRHAGIRSVHSELFHWTNDEHDFAAVRAMMAEGPLGPVFSNLQADQLARAYSSLEGLVSDYRASDGSYRIPVACRLLWGQA